MLPTLFVKVDSAQTWNTPGLQQQLDTEILDVDVIRSVLGRAFDLSKCPPRPTIMHVASSAFCRDTVPSSVLSRYEQISDPPILLRSVIELLTRKSAVCVWPHPNPSTNCVKFQQAASEMDELISPKHSNNIHRATDAMLSGQPAFLPIRYPSYASGSLETLGDLSNCSMIPRNLRTPGGSQRPCLHILIDIANVTYGDANKQRYEPLWGSLAVYLRRTTDSKLSLHKISESISFDFTTKDVLSLIGHESSGRDITTIAEAGRVVEFRLPLDLDYNLADLVLVMQLEQLWHNEHQTRHAIYSKITSSEGKQASKGTAKDAAKLATASVVATSTASVVNTGTGKKTLFDSNSLDSSVAMMELQKKDQNAICSRAANVWKRSGAVRTPVAFGFAPLDLSSLLLSPQPILDGAQKASSDKLMQYILKSHGPVVSGDKIIITPLSRYNHSPSWRFVLLDQSYEDFLSNSEGFHELLEEHYREWLRKNIPEARYIQASLTIQFLNLGVFHRSKNILTIFSEAFSSSSLNPDMTINQTVARKRYLRKAYNSSVSPMSIDDDKHFQGTDGLRYPTELAALLSGATDYSAPLMADDLTRLLSTSSETNLARGMIDLDINTASISQQTTTAHGTVYSTELDNFFNRHAFLSPLNTGVFSNRMYLYINKCHIRRKFTGNLLVRVELRDSDDLSSYTVIQSFYSRYTDNYNPTNAPSSSIFCSSVVQMTGYESSRVAQLGVTTVDLPLLLPSQLTCCAPHVKAAYFGTEFKLELPLVITETMHFFFTVYSVNALHGDKQERLVSLDDTITNTVGGASGINLGTSNFSASMSTASTIYRSSRQPESTVKSVTTHRAIRNDAFTPIGYAYLPLQQFDSAHNHTYHLPSDYLSLRIFETDLYSGYLSVPPNGDRSSSHLLVKCAAKSSIFTQNVTIFHILEQYNLLDQSISRATGSITGTMASSGSSAYETELSPLELSKLLNSLNTRLQDLLEALQKDEDPGLATELLQYLPVFLTMYSGIHSRIILIRDVAENPIVLASMARGFSLLVLITRTFEREYPSSHDAALSYAQKILFSACVFQVKPQYDTLLRDQTQYGKIVSTFLPLEPELNANKASRLEKLDNISKLQEPWKKISNTSSYFLSFFLDSRVCFNNPVPSFYVKPHIDEMPSIIINAVYKTAYPGTPSELVAFIEAVSLHLDADTSLGSALQSSWYSLQQIEKSLTLIFTEEQTTPECQCHEALTPGGLLSPVSRSKSSPQDSTYLYVPLSPLSSKQTPALSNNKSLANIRTDGGARGHALQPDADLLYLQSTLRRLLVTLGQKMLLYITKTLDKAGVLPDVSRLVARVISVCHAFQYDTLGSVLTACFCGQLLPTLIDSSWSYGDFKQFQVVASIQDRIKDMHSTNFMWNTIEAETLTSIDTPKPIMKILACCYKNIYYPFFSEMFSFGLPYIHFSYSQFRRYSKAGRIESEVAPAPPDNLVSIRELARAPEAHSESASSHIITSMNTKQVLPPSSPAQRASSVSTPVSESVVRTAPPVVVQGFSPPQTPIFPSTGKSSQPDKQRQDLFNSIERLTTEQLVPPLLRYFQEIFVHCLMRCDSNIVQLIVLFLKELLFDIPFFTTDAFFGCWDKYNHPAAFLVRPVFYTLTMAFTRVISLSYSADLPQAVGAATVTQGGEASVSIEERKIDLTSGESSDQSAPGLLALDSANLRSAKVQSVVLEPSNISVISGAPSLQLGRLPTNIAMTSAPNRTISTVVIRTIIHLILFAIVYDRDVLSLTTTSLDHLATVCQCISMIPKYYSTEVLTSSQFLSVGSMNFLDHHMANIHQAATRYEMDYLVKSSEFHSATDKMACLVGVYLRQLELLYSPSHISTSPQVDLATIKSRHQRRPIKAKIFRNLFAKKRPASSIRGLGNTGELDPLETSALATPSEQQDRSPVRRSLFDSNATPPRSKNAFVTSRRRASVRTKSKGKGSDMTSVRDPSMDGMSIDCSDVDEFSALQASLLISSVRSSFRNSGKLGILEASTESSILFDNQSDSAVFQLYTIADLATDTSANQALQKMDEQCVFHLGRITILLGLSCFKRVFHQFRILISTIKGQGDYRRIISGGPFYPTLLGPDSLRHPRIAARELSNLQASIAAGQRSLDSADKPSEQAKQGVSFKRLEDVPNSHTLVCMIARMVWAVHLTVYNFIPSSLFTDQLRIKLLDYVRDFVGGYKEYLYTDSRSSSIDPMFANFNIYGVLFHLVMECKDDQHTREPESTNEGKDKLYKKTVELIRLLLREESYRINKVNNISLVQISALFSSLVKNEDEYKRMLTVVDDITKDSNALANISEKLRQILLDRNHINNMAFCINPHTGKQCYQLDYLLNLYFDQAELYFQQPEMRFEALYALFHLLMEHGRQVEAAHMAILMCSLISELTHREANIGDSYDVELRYAIIPGLLISSKSSRSALLSPRSGLQMQHQNIIDSPTISSVISQIPYRLEQIWLFRECIHDFRRLLPGLTIQTEKDVIQRMFDQSTSPFSLHDFFGYLSTAGEIFLKNSYFWQASVVFNLLLQLYNNFGNISKAADVAESYTQSIKRYLAGEQATKSRMYLVSFHNFSEEVDVEEYIYCNSLSPDDFRLNLRTFYTAKYPDVIVCGQGSRLDSDQIKAKAIRIATVVPTTLIPGTDLTEAILSRIQASLLAYFSKIIGSTPVSNQSQTHGLRNVVVNSAVGVTNESSPLRPLSPVPRFSQQRLDAAGFNVHRYIALVLSYVCGAAGPNCPSLDLKVKHPSMQKQNAHLYSFVFKYSYADAHDVDRGQDGKTAVYGQIDRYCFVPYAFPSYKTRQIVIGSYHNKIPPIIASAFRVLEKATSITQHVRNKDPLGQIQLTLSGMLMAFVNKGPVHLAELFLKRVVPAESNNVGKDLQANRPQSPVSSNALSTGNLSIARVISQRTIEGTPQAQTLQISMAADSDAGQGRFSGAFGVLYPGLPGTTVGGGASYDTFTRCSIRNDELSMESRISRAYRASGCLTCPDISSNRESVASIAFSDGGLIIEPNLTCPESLLSNWEDYEPSEYLSISLKYMMEQIVLGLRYSTELCKHGMNEIALQKTLMQRCIEMINTLKLYIDGWDYTPLIDQCVALTSILEFIS